MILTAPIYALKRRAKVLSRTDAIPLARALDQIARSEGYQSWSHLAAEDAASGRASKLLARLSSSALILLAARPGQGKTLLGLELLIEALGQGRPASFFTLEYTDAEVRRHLGALAPDMDADLLQIDTSDQISAPYVCAQLAQAPRGGVVLVDYLQLLDQRRDTPTLTDQLSSLKVLAQQRGLTLICLSQVDRHYDPAHKPLPDLDDLRLPNPVDLSLFDQMIFVGAGKVKLRSAA